MLAKSYKKIVSILTLAGIFLLELSFTTGAGFARGKEMLSPALHMELVEKAFLSLGPADTDSALTDDKGLFDLSRSFDPLTIENLEKMDIVQDTGRNWIWDSASLSMRKNIIRRLKTIDRQNLVRFINHALFSLNKKLPFGRHIEPASVKRIMFKGSYLNNFFEGLIPAEYALPTDVDLIVVLETDELNAPSFLLDLPIPDSTVFLSGERGNAVSSADITFIPEKMLTGKDITYSIAVSGYSLIWGSSFEVFTAKGYHPKDTAPAANVLMDKVYYLLDDALNWLANQGYAKRYDEQIRYSKALKRIIEANCILKSLDKRVDFSEEDISAIAEMFGEYLKKKVRHVPFLEEEKRDADAERIFVEGFLRELKKTSARAEFILGQGNVRNYSEKYILPTKKKIQERISCPGHVAPSLSAGITLFSLSNLETSV